MLASKGYCHHIDGGDVTFCNRRNVDSLSTCLTYCTSEANCVGIGFNGPYQMCNLYPSDNNCPSGYLQRIKPRTATSVNVLVAMPYDYPPWVCYGRNSGEINRSSISNRFSNYKN